MTNYFMIILVLFFSCNPQKKNFLAKKGKLNLRSYSFKRGNVSLDGEWKFYPNQFRLDFSEGNFIYVNIPSVWNQYKINGKKFSSKGFGTFKINLKLPKTHEDLYVILPTIATNYKLYINKKQIASIGKISKVSEKSVPCYRIFITKLPKSVKQELEIVFHVSNFHYSAGGIWNSIIIGNYDNVHTLREKRLFLDFFLIGTTFIFGIYHYILFILRKKEISSVYFGNICMLISIRTSFTSEIFIYNLIPNLNWEIGSKIEYLSMYLGFLFGVLFVGEILKSEIINKIQRFFLYSISTLCLIVLFFHAILYTEITILFHFIALSFVFYIILILIRALKNQKAGIKIFSFGFIAFSLFIVNDILHASQIIFTGYYSQIGFIFLILSQSIVLAKKFTNAFISLESLSKNLEIKVEDRTKQLKQQIQETDILLLNILPSEITKELKINGHVEPKQYQKISILFTDFKGFTKIAENLTPLHLVKKLDTFFTQFDKIISYHNLEKLKTIGDSYMCVGGLPIQNNTHAIDTVLAALEIISYMRVVNLTFQENNEPQWQIRIGIHSGTVVAGVIGEKKFSFDVWGDTVNIASRMESNGITGEINISHDTYLLIKDFFQITYRGEFQVKNKGLMKMYTVNKILPELSKDHSGFKTNYIFQKKYKELENC